MDQYTVVITGANRGLGLSFAKLFLNNHFKVFTLCRTISDELKELSIQYKTRLVNLQCDLTIDSEVKKCVGQIKSATEKIDIILNNAAVHLEKEEQPLNEINFDSIEKTFLINSIAPLRVTKYFVPLLEKGDYKLLINISSEAGSISTAWRDSEYGYCMSKAALNMQSKLLQNHLKSKGIKVLAIHPGWVRTDMGGKQAPLLPEDSVQKILQFVLKEWDLDEPIYYDLEGNELTW